MATVFGLFFAIPATITYNCLIYSSRSN
nr:hypothetical protein [Candidatus Vesicomyosocius sp. SY067_SCS001]